MNYKRTPFGFICENASKTVSDSESVHVHPLCTTLYSLF